jgi:hypothetical protein
VLSFDAVQEICDRANTTLVLHPAIRKAVRGHEEGFYIGLRCFLRGETGGIYHLPLARGGPVSLRFSKRASAGGHNILRVDPVSPDGLRRIKDALKD